MKIIINLVLLFSLNSFSQRFIPNNIKIDSTTKIIGRYPQYDADKTYEKWNFIIENIKEIEAFNKKLILGEEITNTLEDPHFIICLVHNYDEINSWTINPRMGTVMVDGHTYKFDFNIFTDLNLKNPFKYKVENIVFNNKSEYDSYLNLQKKDSTFLFDYSPQFKYEGSFELDFPVNKQYPNPKKISEILEKKLKKLGFKDENYSIMYKLDDKNLANLNKFFTMTIEGSKEIFEKLKVENIENINWTPLVEEGMFFYRTN